MNFYAPPMAVLFFFLLEKRMDLCYNKKEEKIPNGGFYE